MKRCFSQRQHMPSLEPGKSPGFELEDLQMLSSFRPVSKALADLTQVGCKPIHTFCIV